MSPDPEARSTFRDAKIFGSLMVSTRSTPASSTGASASTVQGRQRPQPAFDRSLHHAAVVGHRRVRDPAVGRFHPRPLDAETVVRETRTRDQVHILPPAVVAIVGVAGRLLDGRPGAFSDAHQSLARLLPSV
jgi:hypothetical protein